MIAAAFHTRGDEWILAYKLDVMGQFCQKIIVVLDRPSDETKGILARYDGEHPDVLHVYEHRNRQQLDDEGPDGPICEEGLMRQEAWNIASAYSPDWIILGDTDEVPTPSIVPFLETADRDVDVYYLRIVNLWLTRDRYIGGDDCIWSPTNPSANKKGVICRWRPRTDYKYDIHKLRHTRLEPNPVHAAKTIEDDRHVIVDDPVLIHYKWTNMGKWLSTKQASLPKYAESFANMIVCRSKREWFQW